MKKHAVAAWKCWRSQAIDYWTANNPNLDGLPADILVFPIDGSWWLRHLFAILDLYFFNNKLSEIAVVRWRDATFPGSFVISAINDGQSWEIVMRREFPGQDCLFDIQAQQTVGDLLNAMCQLYIMANVCLCIECSENPHQLGLDGFAGLKDELPFLVQCEFNVVFGTEDPTPSWANLTSFDKVQKNPSRRLHFDQELTSSQEQPIKTGIYDDERSNGD
ncbi:MAG: hypothetical protein Q9213_002839 [Squamulea squamosa]